MDVENMAKNIQELCANGASQSDLIQILTDPDNQQNQFGTVPLFWYENLENKLERIRFMVGEVVDELDGTYEKHAIRKRLQEALDA